MPKQSEPKNAIAQQSIQEVIHTIRGQKVILGRDLALIYGVQTRSLTQAVKRNAAKFPPDFMFQLTPDEARTAKRSRSQFVILKQGTHIKYLPYAFTEHGVVMAANVLNSEQAVTMSVYVVRAFVKLRELAIGNQALERKLAELERKLTARQDIHEKAILQLFKQIRALLLPNLDPKPSKQQIGFRRVQGHKL
jgi:hypothetical protein